MWRGEQFVRFCHHSAELFSADLLSEQFRSRVDAVCS